MLETLQGLTEADWAWVGTVVGSVVLGVIAALKGMKRTPAEVGVQIKPNSETAVILEEVRGLSTVLARRFEHNDTKHDDQMEAINNVHKDTQVIRALVQRGN